MLVYPHPLDYVMGIKYTVTDRSVPVEYTVNPESFYVEEIIDLEEVGFNPEKGEYTVLRVTKRNIETFRAVEILARRLGIPESNVISLGIKDKSATTVSHFFVKTQLIDPSLFPIEENNLRIDLIGFTRRKPTRSIHRGNRFKVVINDQSDNTLSLLREIIGIIETTGLPSYYGYQRFGTKRYNTHLLGKLVLLGREDELATVLLSMLTPREDIVVTTSRLYRNYLRLVYEELYATAPLGRAVKLLLEKTHNLLLGAYASYLYNLLLNTLIETRGLEALTTQLPMPGCSEAISLYKAIFTSEGVSIEAQQNLPCYYRVGLFKPRNNRIYWTVDSLIYEFELNPGMYASIVLREVFKDKLVFN